MLPAEVLVNSSKMDKIDGDNWSFDSATLTIWNNRYWKGFFATDPYLANTALIYAGGFQQRFWMDGNKVIRKPYPFESPVFASGEAIDAEYPGYGKVVLLKYAPPYDGFYEFFKIVGPYTVLGKAFAVRAPPRGEHILTFSLSKRYTVDFMTQEDFRAIFSPRARKPDPEEVIRRWKGRLVSDSQRRWGACSTFPASCCTMS